MIRVEVTLTRAEWTALMAALTAVVASAPAEAPSELVGSLLRATEKLNAGSKADSE